MEDRKLLSGSAPLLSPGSLDPSFGIGGKVVTGFSGPAVSAGYSLATQSDGKFVVAGYQSDPGGYQFALARYNTDGTLDGTFGTGGQVTTAFDNGIGGSQAVAHAVTIQFDGKIVVAGGAQNAAGAERFALARYNANGTPDGSFGSGGEVTTDFGPGSSGAFANGVTLQSDGKIVAAGLVGDAGGAKFALARYNANGTLDGSFGSGGEVTTGFDNGSGSSNAAAECITLQSDGKIVTAGYAFGAAGYQFALARYNTDGTLDGGFGSGGEFTTGFDNGSGSGFALAQAIALQPDGKIVLAGSEYSGFGQEFALARYTPNGTLDASFGSGGQLSTRFPNRFGSTDAAAYAVTVQADGKIVAAGYETASRSSPCFALVRYQSDGTPDESFGSGGAVTTNFVNDYAAAYGIMVQQADGKIVAAGYGSGLNFALARYNADGRLDGTFGGGGQVITPFAGLVSAAGQRVAIQSDGKVVVAGYVETGGPFFALARYNTDGTLDASFGSAGEVITGFDDGIGTSNAVAQAIALQPDGKIVAAGYASAIGGFTFALARYNADGTLDGTFGSGGEVTTAFDVVYGYSSADARDITIQSDGKIIVTGEMSDDAGDVKFALARYNTDGTLDASFGSGGKVTTSFNDSSGSSYAVPRAIRVQADGKIVLAGSEYGDGRYNVALARYNIDGTPDTSFGSDGSGTLTTGFDDGSGSSSSFASDIALQSDGQIVVAGSEYGAGGVQFALARYNTDGSLDSNFGSDGSGTSTTSFDDGLGSSNAAATGIALQADGKIVVAGYASQTGGYQFALARYNTDGTLDRTFGSSGSGEVTTAFDNGSGSSYGFAQGIALQPDGKIVLAGYVYGARVYRLALARYIVNANVPPSDVALHRSSASIDENGSTILNGTFVDPGTLDTHTVDINWGDGSAHTVLHLVANVTSFEGATHQYLDNPGTGSAYPITVTVTDNAGETATGSTTVTVNNVAPTASIAGDSSGVRGQARSITLSAADPSPTDTLAGFTYRLSWGDGTSENVALGDLKTRSHVYTATGTYALQVTATDKDGATGAIASKQIQIKAVELEPDHADTTKTQLVIGGTTGNDVIGAVQLSSGAVQVSINGVSQGSFGPTGRVIVYGQSGNDAIGFASRSGMPAELYGGDGNDAMTAGIGGAILVGGNGSDILIGGPGRDLLIGGMGADLLGGNGGDDILVAGFTDFDGNPDALASIHKEWNRTDLLQGARMANIRNGTGLTGGFRFSNTTIHDDSAVDATHNEVDLLSGGAGSDWFLYNFDTTSGGKSKDVVVDLGLGDARTDLA